MKPPLKSILIALFLATGLFVQGQIMISQYIETNSGTTPKGIEVYNHTAYPIDFSVTPLEVHQGSDGAACAILPGATITSGILGPFQVWVIGTSDLTTAALTGSDIVGVTTYGFNFNGNDALQLYLDGVIMDVIGTCGVNPTGGSWSGGSPIVSTANQNIAIKSGVCSGPTTSWTDPSFRYEQIAAGDVTTGFGDAPGCNPNSITTTFTPNSISVNCTTGYSGNVQYSSTGNFNSGTVFNVELSDAGGSFINSTSIGSTTPPSSTPSGSIPITIPANFYPGSNFRVRVSSDNPIANGSNNGHDIEIINTSPCSPTIPDFAGILLNEFSNGPSGSKEYFELIVVGECGTSVDIRGYIIDDNNGDFGAEGISAGHIKISNHPQWSNIAVGSIIVIYNNTGNNTGSERNAKLPNDDLTDTDSDMVYIIPHNNTTYLSGFLGVPNTTNPNYTPLGTSTSIYTNIALVNDADAIQTRKPNGDYFFGISYGVGSNGGPDNTKISNTNMEKTNVYFNSGDFRNINNWSIGVATDDLSTTEETPGEANNVLNQEWIDMLRSTIGNCGLLPLPVSMVSFKAKYNYGEVELNWKSETELNNDYYEVLHSKTGYDFESVGVIVGSGTVSSPKEYSFKHRNSSSGIHYYRLKSVDYNGKVNEKGTISVQIERDEVRFDKHTQTLHFPNIGEYHIYTTSGQKVSSAINKTQISFSKKGFFLVYNVESGVVTKIIVSR